MTDALTNSEFRAALNSIAYNASNFQVFTFTIAFSFLIGLSVIAGIFVAIQTEDQNMSQGLLLALLLVAAVLVAVMFLAYFGYLRNIGRYLYARVQPVTFGPNECAQSKPKSIKSALGSLNVSTPSSKPDAAQEAAVQAAIQAAAQRAVQSAAVPQFAGLGSSGFGTSGFGASGFGR